MVYAIPLKTIELERVAIIGGIFMIVTRIPLKSPSKMPKAKTRTRVIGHGIPKVTRKIVSKTLVRLMLAATERSIPPETITMVIPSATTANGADCLKIFVMLVSVRK